METNDREIRDYDVVLDAEFGKPGTPERAKAIEEARKAVKVAEDAKIENISDTLNEAETGYGAGSP